MIHTTSRVSRRKGVKTAHGAKRDDQTQGQGADQRNSKQLQRLQEALVQGSNDG